MVAVCLRRERVLRGLQGQRHAAGPHGRGEGPARGARSDPILRERFEREAKTVAALSHPHICPVFDVGEHDGVNFLAMEYLEGETLAQRLSKAALPLDGRLS